MLIVSQNGAAIIILENLSTIFSDANNKVRCTYRENGGGSELARYENSEQARYEMESLALSYEVGEKVFRFSDISQVKGNMAATRQHTQYAKATSRRSMHGGS